MIKENINGQFSLPLFTDRAKAPKSGTYDANINIADEMFNNKITYNYSSPIAGIDKPNGANISSQIIGVIQLQVKTHTSKRYLLTLSNEF